MSCKDVDKKVLINEKYVKKTVANQERMETTKIIRRLSENHVILTDETENTKTVIITKYIKHVFRM